MPVLPAAGGGDSANASFSSSSSSAQRTKRALMLGALAAALVVGAILAGVLGSRAVEKKQRRTPIPIEKVTYTMVTEGLANAVLPVPITTNSYTAGPAQQNTTPTTTTTQGTFNKDTSATSNTTFGTFYENSKKLVGLSTPPASPKFNPAALTLPEGAVAVPSWKAAGEAAASGRVLCYPKTGNEVCI